MTTQRVSIFLVMLFLISCKIFGFQLSLETIVFSDPNEKYKVNDFVRVFQTPDTISSQEAWNRILNGQMKEVPYQGNPGMTNSDVAYWLVFNVSNQFIGESEFRLELSYPQLDLTSLAEVKGDSAKTLFITGDSFKFSQRPIRNHNFVFPITIPYEGEKTFLLNADKRNSAVRFPLRLYSENHFQSKTNKEQIYLTIYYVFLIILVLVLLFIGFGLKKMVFVWYAISVLCYGLWLFTWQGFSYKYLTGNWPAFNRHFLAFCSQIAVMSLLVFVKSFFNTKVILPKFNKIMNEVLMFFVLGTVVWVIVPNTFIAIAPKLFALRYFLVALIMVFSVIAAIKYSTIAKHRSLLFALSYFLFFITIVGKILDEYGLISEFNFVIDPILIGNLVQVLGLTFAMVIILMRVIGEREKLKLVNSQLKATLDDFEYSTEVSKTEYFTLKSKAVLNLDEIRYITADGAYCEFYIDSKDHPEIDRQTLTALEEILPSNFVRIHRSTIVNMDRVRQLSASSVTMYNGQKLVISRTYKERVKEVMRNKEG